MPPQPSNGRGCTARVVLALAALLLAGLLIYIDQRFGAEASAFFLGISLGIPLLLVMVIIVGAIYVLIIRGTVHLQERDGAREITRMRAINQVAGIERSSGGHRPSAVPDPDTASPEEAWSQPDGWHEETPPHTQGEGYQIIE